MERRTLLKGAALLVVGVGLGCSRRASGTSGPATVTKVDRTVPSVGMPALKLSNDIFSGDSNTLHIPSDFPFSIYVGN